MAYAAYESNRNGTDFSFRERDEGCGILGKLTTDREPVAVAETLDDLRLEARAYLGENPEVTLYLTNSENLVHEILMNGKHHALVSLLGRRCRILTALLVLCMTCLVVAGRLGPWSLVAFAAASILYLALIKIGVFNEIEGAVVCEILLILTIVLIPAIQRAIQLRATHHL